ncbi:MAG: hypothetical protein B9S36_05765 [Verrucomicrobiia bacterium Tous-C2TDCM]|nr:MAG: hypothetical protein B9S36_05765 [Verrucomicrobiae bacterium Tous-C2TDCM]
MKTFLVLSLVCLLLSSARGQQTPPVSAPDGNTVYRTWTDNRGKTLEATFRGIENGQVFLQIRDGYVHRIPLERLSPADQVAAKTLKPEGLGIPADPRLAQAAARIDQLVNAGLAKAQLEPNPLASDEQFVRRVYLDIVGRIPTREESLAFINDPSVSKRAKVIDRLLNSDGYRSHLFNYFADMMRVADEANKVRYYTYQDWLKTQIEANEPWDKLVHAMMAADGKLLDNGATGYLLRDAGMRLDNLSLTLSTFLGANVSCAQCHDHPFAEWTQMEFYEMAAFFGATETYGVKGSKGGSSQMMRKTLASIDDKRLQQQAKNVLRVNAMAVEDTGANDLKLPDDYQYDDAKPGDPVAPKLIVWGDEKVRPPLPGASAGDVELRNQFADWMTSADNPRFAMTIANRLWKRAFGVGVREPVTDLDDPEASVNPALLHHLTAEMVRLNFDLKEFMRLLYNTQTYQREATSYDLADNTPYLFPGPILRRMSAEQAWDSCATLVVGEDVDQFKGNRGETYATAMKIDFGRDSTPEEIRSQIENAVGNLRQYAGKGGTPKANNKKKRKRKAAPAESEEEDFTLAPPVRDGLVLARASELPQPEKDQHFLRMFGQSDRQIADSQSDEGSIPQVLMLMNGEAQEVIGQPDSLVIKTAAAMTTPEAQVESLYLSFFSRKPSQEELAKAAAGLRDGLSLSDLTWVLFNTREFVFVE